MSAALISQIVESSRPDLSIYEDLYKYLHSHPELSNQEYQTAAYIVAHLHEKVSTGFVIHSNVGGTGVVAIYHNGDGPKVLLRADIDALPVQENTGLPYASKVRMEDVDGNERPVMHACGHDMHIACLLGAAELLVTANETWAGTLILVFQPAEERGTGARAMVDDGLYEPERYNVPLPDICIGGHVTSNRSGVLGTRRGIIASSADSMRVILHGRGGHASQPHALIDPVVMAAATITRLQTIVSREVNPAYHAVVTVASIQAGNAENIVVDDANLAIDIRAMDQGTRDQLLMSVKRIVQAESTASNAVKAPTFTPTRTFPLTINDHLATARCEETFAAHFHEEDHCYNRTIAPLGFSEDFSILATRAGGPAVFFVYGGTDPVVWDQCERDGTIAQNIPTNHSAQFAPVIQPTLRTGMDAYAASALTWLATRSD